MENELPKKLQRKLYDKNKLTMIKKCPICGSKKIKTLLKYNEVFHYDKCTKCNHIFLNPQPSDDFYNNYYSKYNEIAAYPEKETYAPRNLSFILSRRKNLFHT